MKHSQNVEMRGVKYKQKTATRNEVHGFLIITLRDKVNWVLELPLLLFPIISLILARMEQFSYSNPTLKRLLHDLICSLGIGFGTMIVIIF